MTSSLLQVVETQPELRLAREPNRGVVPVEMIRSKRSHGAAFTLACDCSGLEDKEIAMAMELDAGTFSRMKKGMATLCGDDVAEFCKVVGNTVYVEWLAYQIGCTLVMIQTEAERRAIDAEERARKAEEKLSWALEVLQGRK